MATMVAVSEILAKVVKTADCYDVGEGPHEWFRLIGTKTQHPQTPAIIRAILTDGFNVPICIEKAENGDWKLGNGHHRLACAILLGLDEIPVDFHGWFTSASTRDSDRIKGAYVSRDDELARWISKTAVSHEDMVNVS